MPPEDDAIPVNPAPDNVVVPANPAPANPIVNATPPLGASQVGVFVTLQSVVTFPVATAAVTTIWKVLGTVHAPWDKNKLVPLIIALIIGLFIYTVTVSQGVALRQKILEAGVAIINTFTIAAAALGIGGIGQPPLQ
jgi:hypothetical protein